MKASVHVVRAVLFVVCLVVGLSVARPAGAYEPPSHDGYVTDTAGKLTAAEERRLEDELATYRARTGHEIAVFVVGSLHGESVEDVAYVTFNRWGVGRKEEDDGVLLVIAPAERQMRIETGKGIGHLLTDIDSSHILDERVRPLLRQERWGDAVMAGVKGIEEKLGSADASSPPKHGRGEVDEDAATLLKVIAWAVACFVGFGILALVLRRQSARQHPHGGRWGASQGSSFGSSGDTTSWSSGGTSFGAHFGDSSSSSSSSGGDFGGGDSGGGGASSDW